MTAFSVEAERVQQAIEQFKSQHEVVWSLLESDERVRSSLTLVWAHSEYVRNVCMRSSRLFAQLIESGRLHRPFDSAALTAELETVLSPDATDAEVMRALREFRHRELVRIAWRDLAAWAPIEETLLDQSLLADLCITFAYQRAYRQLAARFGVPRTSEGADMPLVILGMGKLGGYELNFSSDIDLILLYPHEGETDGERSLEHSEFFLRLGQKLVPWLSTKTVDGFVYRVDLRLRPFGDSGPLAMSFAAFENYLQQHGRDWERYAYVKARPITGVDVYREIYDEALRPFVYRRYLDFGVFESLRHMKGLIAREVERRDLQDNVKLGPGGIREIEFMVQAFQLIRGGSDRRLQRREINVVLPQLVSDRLLPQRCVAELTAAYAFLRRVENRLQMWNDEQTHALPLEDSARMRLATAMGFDDWGAFRIELEAHRARVGNHFAQMVFGPAHEVSDDDAALETVLDVDAGTGSRMRALERIGIAQPAPVVAHIDELKTSSYYRKLDDTGRRRLRELLPRLLRAVGRMENPATVFIRVSRLLELIGGRTVYLALLNENTAALNRLVDVCCRSQFLADQIAAHPLLLDELLDTRLFEELPSRAQFAADLQTRHEAFHDEDPERQIETLRHFQRAAIFRVALADITSRLPLMKVSDRLTDIGELIVREALALAWEQLTQKHGLPRNDDGSIAGMVVVAYGKFGGIELGYSSDLDLVFLHDGLSKDQRTDGATPTDVTVFFQRLGQKVVHLLTVYSAAGRLYEVDIRLRPGGNKGLLSQTLPSFVEYQRTEAWTWEHQSLLRSRAVAGPTTLMQRFEAVRLDVLRNAVKRETLRDEVRKMRERMRAELSKAKAGEFDLKQDAGGIADLEFLVQYWVLHWVQRHPEVATFSDNIRQLESLASGALLPQETVDFLTSTYRKYRERLHHLSLAGGGEVIGAEEFAEERARIRQIWKETME